MSHLHLQYQAIVQTSKKYYNVRKKNDCLNKTNVKLPPPEVIIVLTGSDEENEEPQPDCEMGVIHIKDEIDGDEVKEEIKQENCD